MKVQSTFLVCLLLTNLLRGQDSNLRIAVISGEGAIHNINNPKAKSELVVQVEDAAGKPIAGAAVAFSLPTQGAGGTFDNGSQTLTVTTDRTGRAIARGIHLNRQTGPYTIHVTASYQGQTATITMNQINVSGIANPIGPLGVNTKAWVLLGVGVVLIAGAVIAAHNIGGGTNPNALTITAGTPVVGGPQ